MLLGRDEACARVDELLGATRAGRSGALVLLGDAGVGKTALLAYAAERAGGLRVLRARGVESESEIAFSGLFDLLRPVLGRLEDIPQPQAAALSGALALSPASPGGRLSVSAATLSLLAAAGQEQPVLALLDDAHWLDGPSLEALLFAARRLQEEGVAMLFSVREADAAALDLSGLERLELGGLASDAARRLVEQSSPGGIAPAVAERLIAATSGNPLALIELPALLSEAQRAGREPIEEPLPASASVERRFLRQAEGLPDGTRRALLVAAADASGEMGVIAAAAQGVGADAAALEHAEAAGLVTIEGARLEFTHPLVRSAVYHGAASRDRRAVHRALAAALADEPGAARRAWHLAAAALAPDEEVAAALDQAAVAALQRSGYAAAARAFERAARLTPADEPRALRLLRAADASQLAGRYEAATTLLGDALQCTANPLLRADIQCLRGLIAMWGGTLADAVEILLSEAERARTTVPGRVPKLVALAAGSQLLAGDLERALELAREAVAAGGDPGPAAVAAAYLGAILIVRGEVAEGYPLVLASVERLEGAEPLARGSDEAVETALPAFIWLEEHERARHLLDLLDQAASARSAQPVLALALHLRAELDARTGRWSHAYAGGCEAERISRDIGQTTGLAFILAALARIEAGLGHDEDCRAHVAEACDLARRYGGTGALAHALAALGQLELALGRVPEAIEALQESLALFDRHGVHEPGVSRCEPDLVEALVRSGRVEEAETVLARLEASAAATGRPWARATSARCRALLADGDDLDDAFAAALATHEQQPLPFELARTELCYGERLRRAGQRIEARRRLRAALDVFERLGAQPWAERARSELRASGATARRGGAALSNELTGQELQVALLVAQGVTNREAAVALFLSPKTIEVHLGRVYRKLGIRSRVALTRMLAREGQIAGHAAEPVER